MDEKNEALRFYVFCTRHAILRPIARVLRFLEPLAATRERISGVVEKCRRDPGLPCENPTTSFWQQPPHSALAEIQSTSLPKHADVLIIGSGITAASTAHRLLTSDPRITVVIAEARTITSGATGRNGGHILEVPYDEYSSQVAVLGEQQTKELVRFRMDHLEEMLRFSQDQMSAEARRDCEIRAVEFVDAAFDQQQWEELKFNLDRFLKDFPDQQDRWKAWESNEASEKFGMPNVCGAITGPSGAVWPYKFVTSLYAQVLESHAGRFSIETNTPIGQIELAEAGSTYAYTSRTDRGSISSHHIVHATNGHAGHLLPRMRGKIFPLRGQMTVQSHAEVSSGSNSPPTGDRSWVLRYSRGYDYLTQQPGTGHYFLGGGVLQGDNGGHDDIGNGKDDKENLLSLSHLSGVLGRVFQRPPPSSSSPPSRQRLEPAVLSSWTGVMGFSCDWRPWVGKLSHSITERRPVGRAERSCGEWIAAGFCGCGMVYCWRSGQAIADMILGGKAAFLPECLAPTSERFASSSIQDAATVLFSMAI